MTPELKQKALGLYRSGLSIHAVAEQVGCCAQTVSNILRKSDIKRRGTNNTDKWDKRKEEIEYLYFVCDMSQEQIAEYFGSHQAMIGRVMHRLGIKRLSVGRRCGSSHNQFKDGKSTVLYRTLIQKDRCRKCGATENLGIHHKNDDHYDNRLENLEVLCNSCHMSETKRKWWAAKKAGLPTPKSNGPVGWERRSLA
jgi:hypothetical protein